MSAMSLAHVVYAFVFLVQASDVGETYNLVPATIIENCDSGDEKRREISNIVGAP
jgi:hypothetical protein